MSLIQRLFARHSSPEQTARWSSEQWASWLARSARLYFLTSDLPAQREAFLPFLVEPLSDVGGAHQLFREIRDYAPSAIANLPDATMLVLSRWGPDDGDALVRFLLQFAAMVGPHTKDTSEILADLVARLGPPLAGEKIQAVLQDAVEYAAARLRKSDLRRLGELIERRSYGWQIPVWRAQLRLLEILIQNEGLDGLFHNAFVVTPRLKQWVQHTAAKHYAADIVVDGLGLRGLGQLMARSDLSPQEADLRWVLQYCVFPYRVARKGRSLFDQLHGHKEISEEAGSTTAAAWAYVAEPSEAQALLRRGAFRVVSKNE